MDSKRPVSLLSMTLLVSFLKLVLLVVFEEIRAVIPLRFGASHGESFKESREPQKRLRFQKFALVNVSQSRTDAQAFKPALISITVKQAIFTIKVSNKLKVSELIFPTKRDATQRKRAFILNT